MTAIKFCGLTRVVDADFAEQAGAAYLGAILASGPRLLTAVQAQLVLAQRRAGVQRVGVFGPQSDADILRTADFLELDVIQLHGDPADIQVRALQKATTTPIWPVVRVAGTVLPPEARDLAALTGWVVLDAKTVGQLGGTGVALDWNALQESVEQLRQDVPQVRIVLAGGLTPLNVALAIGLLHPDIVDVSSGVESAPGIKAASAITQFVSAVLTATGEV